jgi:hypothetical protein
LPWQAAPPALFFDATLFYMFERLCDAQTRSQRYARQAPLAATLSFRR